MPYRSELSASPQERQPSISPPIADAPTNRNGPGAGGRDGGPGPSKRAKLTQSDIQRMQVEKLLSNPDREVTLPQPVKEKQLRAPYEMMKNVQGSAAGAGSGEFHVYKASRRREYERIKLMEDKGRELEEQEAFRARQEAREAAADAKTAKNRAKRQKRKGGKKGDDKAANNGTGSGGGQAGPAKRKLAGGAEGFRVPGQGAGGQGDEDDSDEEEDRGPGGGGGERGQVSQGGMGNLNIPVPSENGALAGMGATTTAGAERRVVEEPRVVIHDDD